MSPEENGGYKKQIEKLFDSARSKSITKGQIIHYQGDPVTEVYYLRGGYVKAYIILDSGETRTMFFLGRDDIFPISFSLATSWANDTIKYFYEAMSDVSACSLSPDDLKLRTESNPHFTTALLSYMAHANESVIGLLESTKSKSAAEKVAASLPYIAAKTGTRSADGTYRLELKLSHQDIADLCGVTRETVSVALKALQKSGTLKIKNNTLLLKFDD